MSIRLIVDVWDFGPEDPIDAATLAILGNFANEKGLCCYPSVETVSRMTRRSIRTTQRSIGQLANEGWIKVVRGNGRKNLSSYIINVDRLKERATKGEKTIPKGCQADTLSDEQNEQIDDAKGRQAVTLLPDTERVTPTAEKGDSHDRKGVSRDIPIENPKNQDRTGGDAPQSDDSFPEGFDHMKYANAILERNSVPNIWSVRNGLAEAIRAFSRWRDNAPLHIVAQEMERLMLAAQQRGETINQHWFTDQKWKQDGGLNGTTQGHRSVGATGSAARVERALSAWDRVRAERDRARAVR